MTRSPAFVALAALACAWGAHPQARAPALSTEALIARHLAARGGLPAIRAIRTLKMSGTMRPGGFDAHLRYEEVLTRPGAVRIDATLQGLTVVEAYDGRSGWQIQPFQGRKDPETVSDDDLKSLTEEADFDSPLVDAAAKGARIDNLGVIDVDGGPAYALRVSLKNGDEQTYYIDPDAFLTIRVVTRQRLRGAESFTQTDYGDYEKVNGVYFPFEIASGPKGSTTPQRVTFDHIAANAPVEAALFARPAAPVATPAGGQPGTSIAAPGAPGPKPADKQPAAPPPAR